MRPITALLLLSLASCSSSCTTNPNTGRVEWPKAVSCLQPPAADALSAVQGILLQDGRSQTIGQVAIEQLERLAVEYSPSVIACLVDEAVHAFEPAPPVVAEAKSRSLQAPLAPDASVPVSAEPEPERVAAAQRGRDFLQRVAGTRVMERE